MTVLLGFAAAEGIDEGLRGDAGERDDRGTGAGMFEAIKVEQQIVEFARHVHKTRLKANAIFGARILCDPKFEMLLELFVAHSDQRRVSVSGLCNAANVPQTTGLRCIETLEAQGFVARVPDALDGRRSWVEASTAALSHIRLLMTMFTAPPQHQPGLHCGSAGSKAAPQ